MIEGGAKGAKKGTSRAKFSKTDTIGIVKTSMGKVAWLEKGTSETGLLHIMLKRWEQLAKAGYKDGEQVSKLILETISNNKPIGTKGAEGLAYEVKGQTNYLNVVIAKNGYIITAHFVRPKEVKKF